MGHRADHQDRHGAIDEIQRVVGVVEEEDIGQPQHHARDRHRQHRQELEQPAPGAETLGLLDHIGPGEDHDRADDRGHQRHLDGVAIGIPATAVHQVEGVVLQAQAHVVGPELDQRRELADPQQPDDEDRDQPAIAETEPVETAVRFRLVGHRAGRQHRHLALLDEPVDGERDQRRDQQHNRDHRAHLEVLLADHLLVDVDRKHVELPADHLGQAEIGDHQVEHHEGGRDQPVARARDGDGPEGLPPARLQRHRRLVEPRVRDRQRSGDDDHRVREGEEDRPDDDADGAVDRLAHQQFPDHSLLAEQIDQGDARQQRRHQDRRHRDQPEETLEAHATPVQRIGEAKGEADRDDGADQRDE